MKRLAGVALMVLGLGVPACAQRASAHGGFSGHSPSSFHGGFAAHGPSSFHGGVHPSAPGRVAGPPRYSVHRSPYVPHSYQRSNPGTFNSRQAYSDPNHRRMPYHSPDHRDRDHDRDRNFGWLGYPGWYPGWGGYPGWLSPYLPDYGDNYSGDEASQPTQDYASGGYGPQPFDQPGEQGEPEPRPPYAPSINDPQPLPAPAHEEAVTLVFKDGRPSEQIHNYLLTATTLSVLDQHRRDIPVDQIDLSATAKLNHDAGVDFFVPNASR